MAAVVLFPVNIEYDDAVHRPALVARISNVHPGMHFWGIEDEVQTQPNGVQVGNAVLVSAEKLASSPYFQAEKLTLDPASKSKPADIEFLARREGKRLIEFDGTTALIAKLDIHTELIRDRFAELLKCEPWDIGLLVIWKYDSALEIGRINKVIVNRAPSKSIDAEKRAAVWESLLAVIPGSSNGWTIAEDSTTGRVSISFGVAPYIPPRFEEIDLLPTTLSPDNWWLIPVGVDAGGEIVNLNLKAGPHSLIVGGSGSGKSVMTRTITTAALAKGFDVVIIDPVKFAAGLKAFEPFSLGIYKSGLEEASNVMNKVYDEVRRRVEIIDRYDAEIWTEIPEVDRPKPIMLIIDEFASLVMPDAKTAAPKGSDIYAEWEAESLAKANIKSIAGKIALQARSAGVHLVIVTQRADTEFIPGAIRENLGTSIHLIPPTDPPSSQSLTMVFGSRSGAANEEIDKYNDGVSAGLAVAMVEGGALKAFRVGIIEKEDVAPYLQSISAPLRGSILEGIDSAPSASVEVRNERGRVVYPGPDQSVFNIWDAANSSAPQQPMAFDLPSTDQTTTQPDIFSDGD